MIPSRLNQSSFERAMRAARHNRMLQQQVRQQKFNSVLVVTGILILFGALGGGLGWW